MKYIFSTIFFLSISLLAVFPAEAAKLILQTDTVAMQANNSGRINILLDSPDEKINALGGELVILSGNAKLSDINDGQSIISAWLDRPTISQSGSLVFSGIIPGGFSGLYSASSATPLPGTVMSVNLQALDKGTVILGFKNLQAYAGQGESAQIMTEPETLTLNFNQTANAPATNQLVDTLAPTDLDLKIINLPGDNRWFAAFSAQDTKSGIDHYEIQESSFSTPDPNAWQRAESPVSLTDQTRHKYVFVKAVDRNGNEVAISVPPSPKTINSLYYLLASGILLLALLLYFVYRHKNIKK